jgi:L-threonate 2-dehydrogenase
MESTGAVGVGGRPVVGVVGLGTMGGAMAAHLLAAGYGVVGYDVEPRQMAAFEEAGGVACVGPGDVAARSDLLLLSLPSEEALERVVDGPGGVTGAAPPRARIAIETSTLSLEAKERGRVRLAAAAVELLDCPISGTGAQMAARDAVFYLSGDADAAGVVQPVLAACGRAVFVIGPFGAGTLLKLVANHLVTVHNASAAEALTLARRVGLDPAVALDALVAGAGTSRMLEVRGPMMVAQEYRPPSMRIGAFMKDVGIIRGLARRSGCDLRVFEAAAALHERARDEGWEEADLASVHAVVRCGPPA